VPADELLERAVGYTLVGLQGLPPEELAIPTPCAGWDLRTLLEHLADSIAAIAEAAELGEVTVDAPAVAGLLVRIENEALAGHQQGAVVRESADAQLGALQIGQDGDRAPEAFFEAADRLDFFA